MDKRIRRSQEIIEATFWQLWEEQELSDITVTQIIKEANVNRSTFYAHYQDKIDLLEQVENKLLKEFYKIFQKNMMIGDYSDKSIVQKYAQEICHHLELHRKQFTLILSDRDEFLFQTTFQNLFKQAWHDAGVDTLFKIPRRYVEVIVPTMISQVIMEWVKTSQKSTEELEMVFETIVYMTTDYLI